MRCVEWQIWWQSACATAASVRCGALHSYPYSAASSASAQAQQEQGQAAKLLQDSLAAQREWVEQQAAALGERLQAQEAQCCEAQRQLAEHRKRLLAAEQQAAEQLAAGEGQEEWRSSIEAQLGDCVGRLGAAEAGAAQAVTAATGCQEQAAQQAARLDSLCLRVVQAEAEWQRQLQVWAFGRWWCGGGGFAVLLCGCGEGGGAGASGMWWLCKAYGKQTCSGTYTRTCPPMLADMPLACACPASGPR